MMPAYGLTILKISKGDSSRARSRLIYVGQRILMPALPISAAGGQDADSPKVSFLPAGGGKRVSRNFELMHQAGMGL